MAPVEGEARDHHLLTKDVEEVVIVVAGVEEVGEEEVAAVADRNLPEATEYHLAEPGTSNIPIF